MPHISNDELNYLTKSARMYEKQQGYCRKYHKTEKGKRARANAQKRYRQSLRAKKKTASKSIPSSTSY